MYFCGLMTATGSARARFDRLQEINDLLFLVGHVEWLRGDSHASDVMKGSRTTSQDADGCDNAMIEHLPRW